MRLLQPAFCFSASSRELAFLFSGRETSCVDPHLCAPALLGLSEICAPQRGREASLHALVQHSSFYRADPLVSLSHSPAPSPKSGLRLLLSLHTTTIISNRSPRNVFCQPSAGITGISHSRFAHWPTLAGPLSPLHILTGLNAACPSQHSLPLPPSSTHPLGNP